MSDILVMFLIYLILTFLALIGFVVFVVIDNSHHGKVKGHSNHVVFLALDGLSSRNLERANTPNIDFIKHNGAWTSKVSIDPYSNGSGPNWVAMLTGHNSTSSNITDNSCKKPKYSTVMDQLMQLNKTVAVSTQWHEVKCFINKVTYYQDEKRALTDIPRLINTVHAGYSFVFIHVDNLDFIGHRFSGGSNIYTKEVEKVDNDYVGPLLEYVTHTDGYTLIITSDHGHKLTSKDHSNDPISLFMYGKGIKKGKLHPIKNVDIYYYLKQLLF